MHYVYYTLCIHISTITRIIIDYVEIVEIFNIADCKLLCKWNPFLRINLTISLCLLHLYYVPLQEDIAM